jgi:peptidyl-Asp metalloendopeptidase
MPYNSQGDNKRWNGKIRTVRPRRRLAVLIYLGLMASLFWGLDCPAAANDLFLETTLPVQLGQADPAFVKRSRVAQVNWQALGSGEVQTSAGRKKKSIRLNLFPDTAYTAWVRQTEITRNQEIIWQGGLEGTSGSEVTLVMKDRLLVGNVSFPGGRFQIRFLEDGIHRIREVDPSGYPKERDPIPILTGEDLAEPVPEKKELSVSFQKLFLPLILKPPVVDVMVGYTQAVRAAAGGTSAINALIALAVSETNTGFDNSGVAQRINLVHTLEASYSEAFFDWDSTLDRLQGTNDGFMDQVHPLRDAYRADLVVLLVNDGEFCGQGYLMETPAKSFASWAFSLVNWECATGNYSLAHEMGHNMGCEHDRDNAGGFGSYPYSFGYQAPDQSFRTIMAYDCLGGCPRINYWSNPEVFYNGRPTGVVFSSPFSADNRRSLNNTAPFVGNFR